MNIRVTYHVIYLLSVSRNHAGCQNRRFPATSDIMTIGKQAPITRESS